MKYNTIPITNIDDEKFVGGFNGVEFEFDAGQKRYLPSMVSQHLAEHLVKRIISKNKSNGKTEFEDTDPTTIKGQVLDEEIITTEPPKEVSFKEEVDEHEREFAEWKAEQDKKDLLNKEKAMDIANQSADKTEKPKDNDK